jgi:hypothetical protein
MKEERDELPNVLIRAFERHFIYDRDKTNHLRNIPFFIENVIKSLYSHYKAVYVIKRFTGTLLGYMYKLSNKEYTLIIPCLQNEKHEILFLLNDCFQDQILDDTTFTIIFPNDSNSYEIIKLNNLKTFK